MSWVVHSEVVGRAAALLKVHGKVVGRAAALLNMRWKG
jgi:hypothetical protein